MKVLFIHHSSFLVETPTRYLLFDYYQGKLPEMDKDKPLYVFASHRHGDHFSPAVFALAGQGQRVRYVLSDDIWRKRVPAACLEQTVFLGPNEARCLEEMRIETLKSTDEGVAFVIETDGETVYHAGDLNDWYWEESSQEENRAMTRAYREEIGKLKGRALDVAFVVVDPRQGEHYDRGIRYFMEHVQAKRVYPMHMWGEESLAEACRNEEWAVPYRDRLQNLESVTGL